MWVAMPCLKFNLTGLSTKMGGVTTWELRTILASNRLTKHTDFYDHGVELTGTALNRALEPWR